MILSSPTSAVTFLTFRNRSRPRSLVVTALAGRKNCPGMTG